MALAGLKFLKFCKPNQVQFITYNENLVSTGLRIISNNYGVDVTKQRDFQRSVENWDSSVKKSKTSKAMKAYLERAKEHDEFMKQQEISYQIGKRHLANMMGEDPSTFTQKDVDRSIEYLFPSAIYDKRAKPMMKPPSELYPARKAAEFDEAGRPHDFLFYTGKPNFFRVLFDIVTYMKELEKYHDSLISKKIGIDPNTIIDASGYSWLNKEEFEGVILETIMETEYDNFIQTIERLMSMPYSNRYLDFVNRFRKQLIGQKKSFEIAKPSYDSDGRAFVTTYECLRKAARGDVTVRSPGTGKITINGKDITYFEDTQSREQSSRLSTRSSSPVEMDNFGYKEPGVASKPSRRVRTKRAVSVYAGAGEELPLASKYKTTTAASVRWRGDPEAALDQVMPSGDFEYMEVGPSPPAESAPNMYDSFEEPAAELSVQVCADSIRLALLEQARQLAVRASLLDDIESMALGPEAALAALENAPKPEKNICFLWAAFHKRRDLLDPILRAGADLHCHDSGGMSAVHLSSFSGCLACTGFLISKGADVNGLSKCFSPLHCAAFGNHPETAKLLINNGALVNLTTKKTNCEETVLHCAVRANAVECLQLFIAEGVDVNSIEPSGMNPIHLAADLGMTHCLELLLNSAGADVNSRTRVRDKESTALHLAADEGNADCVDLLLSKGADAKLKNHRGFTALHLAARSSSLECVESLLRNGNADPNAEDYDKRTPLHAAIGKSESAFDIIETLISWGANVNQKDEYGFTPLHLASLDGLSHCVETLIFHGADVTTKSKKGNSALNVITRKTPASMAMITQKLDCAITLHNSQDSSNREVELELDFRNILQHCHPREISYLNTFVDEGQKEILLHPLCSAFLHIKWEKIRKYYIARLFFCFMFVLFLTLYVLTALAHNCYNGSKDKEETIQEQELCQKQSILGDLLRKNPFVIEMQWWVLAAITIFEIFRKVYGIAGYSTVRQYLTQPENIIEWFVIVSVFLISYIYTNSTYTWQNHVGAFAVLAGWTNLMLMIGQLPVFGSYVAMYQKVQKEFAKLFMAYSCILIGFTFSFCVIFPDSSSFANPFMGFITVLTMMIGELDLGLLLNDPDGNDPPFLLEISAQITYVLFLMFVTVVLMNLLVGIAVHDIQGLRKTAGLSKLVRQTKLISYMELALFNAYLPKFLLRMLHWSALVSPQAYRVVLSVKPLNPGEKRLPRDIMMAAYDIAKMRKHYGHTISSKGSSATYHSFKRYDNNNESGVSDYSYDTGLCALQMKVDEGAERIEVLTAEIKELKDMIKSQHTMMIKLLSALPRDAHHIENTSNC